ncbi:hypothetical protein Hanom_Chr09g00786401 [Helianthus anomalus]
MPLNFVNLVGKFLISTLCFILKTHEECNILHHKLDIVCTLENALNVCGLLLAKSYVSNFHFLVMFTETHEAHSAHTQEINRRVITILGITTS